MRKIALKIGELIYWEGGVGVILSRNMTLPIKYCVSTDRLVDLYLIAVLKLLLNTHFDIWRK